MQRFFPSEPLTKVDAPNDIEYIEKLIFQRQRAILMECRLTNVELVNPFWGDLYLSKDKSYNIVNGTYYNGRILSADELTCSITEIDYIIIKEVYRFNIAVLRWYKSPKAKLPQCMIDFIIKQYQYKTSLKGVPGDLNETLYMKSKNRLNGIYGLFATAPIRTPIEYRKADRDFYYSDIEDMQELFEKNKSGYWLPYQFGIWTTALARYELYKGIKTATRAGADFADFVYCDTDSVKYIGNVDWTEYNNEKIRLSTASGAYADDAKGKRHYMGVFESEGDCTFKSCGSKKYATLKNGKLSVTIAGVDKKRGAAELAKHGGLAALQDGFVFREAGGLCAKYNDQPEVTQIVVEGEIVPITSNLYLSQSEYTVGTLEIYKRIITMSKINLDRIAKSLYNEGVLKSAE